ncbi:MAG: hypothetical protein EHM56_03740 [Chloroflexi bacterium]|nr:MAG: hypothetical protein EHM56_03740 [Chloroflexota bacterium]
MGCATDVPTQHLAIQWEKARRLKRPLEAAVFIGGPPALLLAAATGRGGPALPADLERGKEPPRHAENELRQPADHQEVNVGDLEHRDGRPQGQPAMDKEQGAQDGAGRQVDDGGLDRQARGGGHRPLLGLHGPHPAPDQGAKAQGRQGLQDAGESDGRGQPGPGTHEVERLEHETQQQAGVQQDVHGPRQPLRAPGLRARFPAKAREHPVGHAEGQLRDPAHHEEVQLAEVDRPEPAPQAEPAIEGHQGAQEKRTEKVEERGANKEPD